MIGKMIIAEDSIKYNVNVIRSKTNARVIAVVKENGYGIGLYNEYKILKEQKIDMFAFSCSEEAIRLREYGCMDDILLMTPVWDLKEAKLLLKNDIVMTLESLAQAEILLQAKIETGITPRVHIKIDSGMGRYGFYFSDIPDLSDWKDIFYIEGCFSHLAGHKSNYEKSVRTQINAFDIAIKRLRSQGILLKYIHLANSKAVMTFGDLGYNTIRVGSALVGKCAGNSALKEAVWLEAPVFSIVEKPKGATIGYQSQTLLKHDSKLAIIRIGHGSGVGMGDVYDDNGRIINMLCALKRLVIPKKTPSVYISGVECNIMGKIGVAHMVVDITGTNIRVGDIMKMSINPLYINSEISRCLYK